MRHQDYLNRCYELAKLGGKYVGTNPNVGAVIVYNDRIIGEGYHEKYGHPHAEVNAFRSVSPEDEHLLPESTIYVSLEPCSHFGKTPPCANLLVEKRIKSCHIGTIDSSDKVSGKGVSIIENNGVEVTVHNDPKALELIEPWLVFTHKERPFVTLKFAQSQDRFIGQKEKQVWLSNQYSKVVAHQLRATHDAILIGTNTARIDNPSLTTRVYPGEHPIRLVIDKHLSLDNDLDVFHHHPTVIFNAVKDGSHGVVKYVKCLGDDFIPEILAYCHQQKIARLLVEGGAQVLNAFVNKSMWDQAYVIDTKKVLNTGIKAPNVHGHLVETIQLDEDIIRIIRNK